MLDEKRYGKTFDVNLDDNHMLNVIKLENLLTSNGYSFNRNMIVNTYYVDLVYRLNNKYQCAITIIDKDVDYDLIAKKTFALSLANNYVGYVINANNIDISKPNEYDVLKFINKYYDHMTIISDDNIYNIYQSKRITKIKQPKIDFKITRCENNTYYKISQLLDRK
jgi:hypothetical protein